jgi:regulator of CtrA degradation
MRTCQDDSSPMGPVFEQPPPSAARSGTISFIHKLTTSNAFKALFKEGMALVEEAASYLDGQGRREARDLPRPAALAYATESMRLTTRLMQVASRLLVQRALNEGVMTASGAATERHRVRLSHQDIACPPEIFEKLPKSFRDLSLRSIRLQARLMHLDRCLFASGDKTMLPSPIERQVQILRAAFQVAN